MRSLICLLCAAAAGCSWLYDPDGLPASDVESDAGDPGPREQQPDADVPVQWTFEPSNVPTSNLPAVNPAIDFACTLSVDTSGLTVQASCLEGEELPALVVLAIGSPESGGSSEVVVLYVDDLRVDPSGDISVSGSRPLVIVSRHDIVVDGEIHGDAALEIPGPGGAACAAAGRGASGENATDNDSGSGAGGGSFGGLGAPGGDGDNTTGAGPGATTGDPDLVPLRGGCPGGDGGDYLGDGGGLGGGGGGAIQLTARLTLEVRGRVTANGGGGRGAFVHHAGGGGGGSGGALLLEADEVDIDGGRILTNAGGGGSGKSKAIGGTSDGSDGQDINQPAPGGPLGVDGGAGAAGSDLAQAGTSALAAGGGGGGGLGRILVRGITACALDGDTSGVMSTSCD